MKPNLRNWSFVSTSYNDGVMRITRRERTTDKYGTPTSSGNLITVSKHWFRRMGTTSQDQYHAFAMDRDITAKVGIPGYFEKEDDWVVVIDDKFYEVHRIYYNGHKNESEFCLVVIDGEGYNLQPLQ